MDLRTAVAVMTGIARLQTRGEGPHREGKQAVHKGDTLRQPPHLHIRGFRAARQQVLTFRLLTAGQGGRGPSSVHRETPTMLHGFLPLARTDLLP